MCRGDTTEIWKDSPIYPDRYEVSNLGRVRNKSLNKIMKQQFHKDGYYQITLSKNKVKQTVLVHRLVASLFCEGEEGSKEVNHKDCDKTNNSSRNLEWVTRSDNLKHAYKNKLMEKIGSRNGRSLLKEDDVKSIKDLYIKGNTVTELSKIYKISDSTISAIINGKTWRHV